MQRRYMFLSLAVLFGVSVLAPASLENRTPDGAHILIARGHGGHGHGGRGNAGREGPSTVRTHGSGHGSSRELKREEVPAQVPVPGTLPKTSEQ